MKVEFGDYFDKVLSLVRLLTKITFAFAAAAVLFQLTTGVKLFDKDVVSYSSEILRVFGFEKLAGIISIMILYYLLKK